MNPTRLPPEVAKFLYHSVDTVPELEALLIFQHDAGVALRADELSQRLYIPVRESATIAAKLLRLGLLVPAESDAFRFNSQSGDASVVQRLSELYQKHLSMIARLIHEKPSLGLREFAQAFSVKKKEE